MKTLEKLFIKAQEKGTANLNGRITEYDYGHKYVGDLQSKYRVTIENNYLTLEHWETVILELDLNKNVLTNYYLESRSDAQAINFTLNYFNIKGKCHYYPSKEKYTYENN